MGQSTTAQQITILSLSECSILHNSSLFPHINKKRMFEEICSHDKRNEKKNVCVKSKYRKTINNIFTLMRETAITSNMFLQKSIRFGCNQLLNANCQLIGSLFICILLTLCMRVCTLYSKRGARARAQE